MQKTYDAYDACEGAPTVSEVGALLVSEEDGAARRTEMVAVEMRADIFVNDAYWASSAISPADFEDYAFGVLFSAGIISRADDIASVDVSIDGDAVAFRVRLRDGLVGAQASSAACVPIPAGLSFPGGLGARAVSPASVPGCIAGPGEDSRRFGARDGYHEAEVSGFAAGLVAAEHERALSAAGASPSWKLAPDSIWLMSRALLSRQGMHRATGATHAAVFADAHGAPVLMREDVGRHNAVEKLVGAMIREDVDASRGFAYLSSRCALELVAKCARAGILVVATVSAPTTAVIDYAAEQGVALAAFAREGRFTVYSHPERLAL